MLMKLPALLELLCLLVMVNVSMVEADTSESRRNGTVPNLDIDAMKGLVNILNSSSFMSNETLDGDYTVVKVEDPGCHDYLNGSQCCGKLGKIPEIKEHDDNICVNMTFKDNGTDIKFYLTWNGDVKMSGHLLDFKEDICVTVPIPKIGPLVGICLFFSRYSRVNETISSCVNLKLKIITLSFDVCLGCFGDAGHTCSAAGPGHSYSFLLFTMVLIRLFH